MAKRNLKLIYDVFQVSEDDAPPVAVRSGADVARALREVCAMRAIGRESFWVVLLDARHKTIGFHMVSLGTLTSAPVHPREVFKLALRAECKAIVIAHNHPSGDPTPSQDDRVVTERLRQCGEMVGIEVLDHIIVGTETYYTFAEERTYTWDHKRI